MYIFQNFQKTSKIINEISKKPPKIRFSAKNEIPPKFRFFPIFGPPNRSVTQKRHVFFAIVLRSMFYLRFCIATSHWHNIHFNAIMFSCRFLFLVRKTTPACGMFYTERIESKFCRYQARDTNIVFLVLKLF